MKEQRISFNRLEGVSNFGISKSISLPLPCLNKKGEERSIYWSQSYSLPRQTSIKARERQKREKWFSQRYTRYGGRHCCGRVPLYFHYFLSLSLHMPSTSAMSFRRRGPPSHFLASSDFYIFSPRGDFLLLATKTFCGISGRVPESDMLNKRCMRDLYGEAAFHGAQETRHEVDGCSEKPITLLFSLQGSS